MKLASRRDKKPLGNPGDTHHCGRLLHRRRVFIFHGKSSIGWTMLLFLLSIFPIYSAFVTQVPQRASRLGQCSVAYRETNTPSNGSKIRRGRFEMTTTTASEGQTAQALKRTIIENAADTSNGLEATKDQRDVIAKAINELVALNPTEDITTSDLATGMWNLVYTTTKGASGGKLGPFVGSVQQEVDVAGGIYINYVGVGPLTGKLDATWEVLNKKQWKVIFKTIQFSLWGQQLVSRDLAQEGIWTLSYLDEDFRVLTARSMERDTGNLYVLGRT